MKEVYINAIIEPRGESHWTDSEGPDVYFRNYAVQARSEEEAMLEVDNILGAEKDIAYTIRLCTERIPTNRERKPVTKNIELLL